MTVIFYIAIFAAIVAVLGVGGALCESEDFEERLKRAGRRASSFVERALKVVLLPVEAATYIYESIKTR